MGAHSHLASVLGSGTFTVTAELGPPKGNRPEVVRKKARLLRDYVDAVNITDNQTAVVRMSSIAASVLAIGEGVEPVAQMVCRDRNRIAMQSDIIGAAALGISNILCLSGDHQAFGTYPYSKSVFDIDSMQLLGTVKRMRDEKKLAGQEEEMKGEIDLFIGAAANPFAEPFDYRPYRLLKKVAAGADFIQTQCVYDIPRFEEWMRQVKALGLHEKCHILAGLTPLKSARMASHMAENVAGMLIPEKIVKRMSDTPKERQPDEGIQICLELLEQLSQMLGVSGVHIMAIGWEKAVPRIVEKAGLLPRPTCDILPPR
ncbi:MAG: methylenetetrahydrofolate reductase [Myxococcota bacterium]|nr:methylenetetrahydrofolate reductase [Myxococcota bacterium]